MRKTTQKGKDEPVLRKPNTEDEKVIVEGNKRLFVSSSPLAVKLMNAAADLTATVIEGENISVTSKRKRGRGRPRGGFKKEKTQISQLIAESNGRIRITALLERGLVLAMREEKQLAPLAQQARFLMQEAAPSDQMLWMDLMVTKYGRVANAYDKCGREYVLAHISAARSRPDYKAALEEMLNQSLAFEYDRP
jgi:hypothetical protein